MEKKVVIINDDLGTMALGFSRAGYEVEAIYIDQSEKNSVNILTKNWNEQVFPVDWSVYHVSEMVSADLYAGRIQFPGISMAGAGRKQEYADHNMLKIAEILHIKRPSAFLFQFNRVNDRNEAFRYFCEKAIGAGYQIRYNAIDIHSLTGLPVSEKEFFVFGTLMQSVPLLEIKETEGVNYDIEDICEKGSLEDEWYYRLSPGIRIDVQRNSYHSLLCWKGDHYAEAKYVVWNPRMVPLVVSGEEIRKMTHREVARLKGIPDNYFTDIKNKSWLYQKLMFSTNVSAVQQIVSAFNYSIGERTLESRKVSKGLEFETIVKTYLKNKKVSLIKKEENDDVCVDFRCKIGTDIFAIAVKIYAGNNGIEKRVLDFCSRFSVNEAAEDDKYILIIGNVAGKKTKQTVWEKYHVSVWDIENLLWLFDEFQQLKSDFVSLLSFSVGEIEPREPELNIFEQHAYSSYNIELQEKLRKIKPGEDFAEYEKLCVDIVKYLFSEDLEFIGEQKKSNDGLYRFDCCCKIKHGELKEFFDTIQRFFNTKYIVFEFKNYAEKITQKEIYTTEKYLYEKALRKVAVIVSRKGADINAQKAARGCLRENGKLIICLSDADINNLIDIKSKSGIPGNALEAILDNMLIDLEK